MTRLLIATAVALAGCTLTQHQDVAHDDVVVDAVPTRLTFDLGAGDLDVRVDPDRTDVQLIRTLRWSGARPEPSARMSGGVLALDDGCRPLQASCRVDHEVVLPASAVVLGSTGSGTLVIAGLDQRVAVDTGSGDVHIEHIGGSVTATTGSGGIVLRNIAGDVDVDSGSGDIDGYALGGASVIASTGSGHVDLVLDGKPRRITIDTGSGDVALALPPGAYSLSTDTGSGQVRVDGVQRSSDGARVDIETGSGDISVQGG